MGLRFGLYALSGIIFIPFLVKQYGSGSYGLIALAGFLTQYIGLLSGCVGSSVGRFMNIALNKNDWQQANEIFSTAIVANLVFVLVQIPLFALAVWKLELIIDFPPDQAKDFRILVGCNIAVFFIAILKGVIFTPILAANRLDINAKFDIYRQIARLILLIALILSLGPYLWIIGVVDLALSLVMWAAGYKICRKMVRGKLTFKRRYICWKWVKPVMNMAGWSIVASMGQALFLQTDIWVINRFVSMELAGVCAALLLWPNFVQQIAKNITSLILPVIIIDYAHGRFERIQDVVMFFSRMFSILAIFVCGFLMIWGGDLLEIWMGADYRKYHLLLVLMLLHFPLTLAREAIWGVFPAYNKMHYLGISNLVSGCLNVGLSLLAVYYGYGLIGVVLATGISLILQRTVFISLFVVKMLKIHWVRLFKCYVPGGLVVALFLFQWIAFNNVYFIQAGVISIVIGLLFCVEVFVREKESRVAIKSIFSNITNK